MYLHIPILLKSVNNNEYLHENLHVKWLKSAAMEFSLGEFGL
jgi:hypothetical protein